MIPQKSPLGLEKKGRVNNAIANAHATRDSHNPNPRKEPPMPYIIHPVTTALTVYATLEEAIEACDIKIDYFNQKFEIFEIGKDCVVERHASNVSGGKSVPYTTAYEAIKVLREKRDSEKPKE